MNFLKAVSLILWGLLRHPFRTTVVRVPRLSRRPEVAAQGARR